MNLKPAPQPDVRFVFHPEEDATYEHFSPGMPAFDGHATQLGRRNAWWLAEAALLSYSSPASAVPRFRAAGFDAVLLEAGALQCYIASTDHVTIVAFRGTEPDEWGDVLDDALYVMAPWVHAGSHVHLGFKAALDRVWSSLAGALSPLIASRRVWFTGHSLGAALATLAADRFPDAAGVCTFGSPRVGDRAFARQHDERFGLRAARYVNDADVVTHVPPRLTFPYTHVGGARYIGPDGRVSPQRPLLAHYIGDLFGRTRPLFEMTQGFQQGHLKTAPDFLLDHMPRSYTVALWNDYVLNGE
jgi:triacylglycerol lipase